MTMNLAAGIDRTIRKLRWGRESGQRVHLTLSPSLQSLSWRERGLGRIYEVFLANALALRTLSGRLRVSACMRRRLRDLESFLSIAPLYWIDLGIDGYVEAGLNNAIEKTLGETGYGEGGWFAVEDSEAKLGVFHPANGEVGTLVVFLERRGMRHRCNLLVPVNAV